jgi:hypothetical protein
VTPNKYPWRNFFHAGGSEMPKADDSLSRDE